MSFYKCSETSCLSELSVSSSVFDRVDTTYRIVKLLCLGVSVGIAFVFMSQNFVQAQTSETSTTTSETCELIGNNYSNYAALIDKNRLFMYGFASNVDNKVREWSRSKYLYNTEPDKMGIFVSLNSDLGVVDSTISREIPLVQNNKEVKQTCKYRINGFENGSVFAGASLNSEDYTAGFIAHYSLGGFGFKENIKGIADRTVNNDNAFGASGFVAFNTPFLFNGLLASSLSFSSFDNENTIKISEVYNEKDKVSMYIVRSNNFWAKNFLFGNNAINIKMGPNLEFVSVASNSKTITQNNTANKPFKSSEELSIFNLETAAGVEYSRAWTNPQQDIFEIKAFANVAYGLGNLGDAPLLKINLKQDVLAKPDENISVATFKETLIYDIGASAKRSFGVIEASLGSRFRAMSGEFTSSNELALTVGLSASF